MMDTANGPLGFSLPINADAVFEILTRDRVMKTNPAARMQQAKHTAWRIIKEWIMAQMALVETEMVTVEEVFMPYMLTGKQTLYQALSNGDLKCCPAPTWICSPAPTSVSELRGISGGSTLLLGSPTS